MHILFIGYGKTSQRVAKHLFEQGHHISTISRSVKTDDYATHHIQDVQQLDLSQFSPIDLVYIALAPSESSLEAYQQTYVDSVVPIVHALQQHPIQRIILLSSTRVYGEHHGEIINDESIIQPHDAQGHLLHQMEQLWQHHYPKQTVIVRPTGIYGTSIARLKRLAEQTASYPNMHWSNRIHIEDLAKCLAMLGEVASPQQSYIVTDNLPMPLHEIVLWFQQQLGLPLLQLESETDSGKRIYATRLAAMAFQYDHPVCLNDYKRLLQEHRL